MLRALGASLSWAVSYLQPQTRAWARVSHPGDPNECGFRRDKLLACTRQGLQVVRHDLQSNAGRGVPLLHNTAALPHSVALRVAWQALTGGDASKLSGKLQWASQSAFKGFGRAMLRPLIDHQRNKNPALSMELRLALTWWAELLQLELRQYRTHFPRMLYLTSVTCQGPQGLAQAMHWQTVTHVRRRKEYASKSCGSTLQECRFDLILHVTAVFLFCSLS